jgi:hypothetical protein
VVPGFKLKVLRWAPVGDTVMIEWEGSAMIAHQLITWRGVDRISLRDGKTYEGQAYWDTRGLAETMAEVVASATATSAS